MSEELESCPLCGALPADQVDCDAVKQRVRNRYTFSRQGLLDGCAPMTAPTPAGEEGDHLLWRLRNNDTAKHLCGLAADEIERLRRLLSSPRVERARALEEAAAIAEGYMRDLSNPIFARACAENIASRIRSLSPQGG